MVAAFLRVLRANSIRVKVSPSASAAHRDLCTTYDAVIIDCDDMEEGGKMLENIRKAEVNRKAVVFAVIHGVMTSKNAYDLGSNFVLEKPLSADLISRSVQAGKGLIMSDRRRHFRCPVGAVTKLRSGNKAALEGVVLNVSDSGMAVQVDSAQLLTGNIKATFQLPGSDIAVKTDCIIQWASAGKLGLRFANMEPESQLELHRWLSRKIQAAPHLGINPSA